MARTPDSSTTDTRRGRGQIVARGEGTYLLRVYRGTDPVTGGRKYTNETVRGTLRAAQRRLTALLGTHDEGKLVDPSKRTVDAVLDQWLEHIKPPAIGLHTHADYTNLLKRYVRPVLGSMRIQEVLPEHVDAVYAAMQAKGLTTRTIRTTHLVLRAALKQAVRWRIIATNPAADIDMKARKGPSKPDAPAHSARTFTPEQVTAFLEAAEYDDIGALFTVLLATGMRPGEAFGLGWSCIDFDAARITVNRALVPYGTDGADEGWTLAETKTKATRTIKVDADTIATLKAHRAAQAEARLKAGWIEQEDGTRTARWVDRDFVFTNSMGGPLELRNVVQRHFKPILKAAGLPKTFRLYDLRHSHASLLLASGQDPVVVSKRLGHAKVSMTLDVYTHALPAKEDAAADTWAGLVGGK